MTINIHSLLFTTTLAILGTTLTATAAPPPPPPPLHSHNHPLPTGRNHWPHNSPPVTNHRYPRPHKNPLRPCPPRRHPRHLHLAPDAPSR
ncbi:hypothetical protein Ga0100230_013710 [Opitutaceae bacterium TAV3]|nr:hypothetical protein Ga0100230_013710 [Opitutaceae bacterium TAV3]